MHFTTGLPLILLAFTLHLLPILCANPKFDVYVLKNPPDAGFYNLKHWHLAIMPAGQRTKGWLIHAKLRPDGITYERIVSTQPTVALHNPALSVRSTPTLLVAGISAADKDAILANGRSAPVPNPMGTPHKNCQHFVQDVVVLSAVNLQTTARAVKSQPWFTANLVLEPGQPGPGEYFAHTWNQMSGLWTYSTKRRVRRALTGAPKKAAGGTKVAEKKPEKAKVVAPVTGKKNAAEKKPGKAKVVAAPATGKKNAAADTKGKPKSKSGASGPGTGSTQKKLGKSMYSYY